ncbi:branched-chain amino acid transport [Fructobacillus fructosus]|uniref:branched-chain amino acid transporter permease n=1 Tax=Fructobacillus fructosus TaxID=1631 RepID=UPI0002194BAB|nr:AzlD domain-containing protein [Fructobacillus fructosus]KRN52858.1 branched-chain amino acid transport [Fructobacillus fructosus KCTC 3544]GAP01178.1 branched-chain amino acid transport [Fructobacillus fructosus]
MSLTNEIMTISIAAIATFATRFLPFIVFSGKKETPPFIVYLGERLPPAILGILVVYCYKSQLLQPSQETLFALVAGTMTIAIQFWRNNMLLSIFVGTLIYVFFGYIF